MKSTRFGTIFGATIGRILAMPIELNWKRTYAWERAQSSSAEILENDPHSSQVYDELEATDLDDDGQFQSCLSLARDGSIYSMNETAYCYEIGRGIELDAAEAERWYAEASARGSEVAMIRCANRMASRGDYESSVEILQRGVDNAWAQALFWQSWYRFKRCEDATTYRIVRPMLHAASEAGHPGADWYLARLMARGVFGLENRTAGWQRLVEISTEIVKENKSSAEA